MRVGVESVPALNQQMMEYVWTVCVQNVNLIDMSVAVIEIGQCSMD